MTHKFELVLACVNHAHLLKHTLPVNTRKFDNVIVVTTPTDFETQKIASENQAQIVTTDLFYKYGAPFNRGLAINEAFRASKYNDWIIHTDADIIFPRGYEQVFAKDNQHINKEVFYGSKRIEFKDYEEYKQALEQYALFQAPTQPGKMIDEPSHIGCGFFQMFNLQSAVVESLLSRQFTFIPEFQERIKADFPNVREFTSISKDYDDLYPSYPSCGGSDVMFRAQWSPEPSIDIATGELVGRQEGAPACSVIEIAIPVWHLGTERDHTGRRIFKF
jgi:hypothetical protein